MSEANYPLETRIALIMLHCAAADGVLSDTEFDHVAKHMGEVLTLLEIEGDADAVLRQGLDDFFAEERVLESIEAVGDLSKEMRVAILEQLKAVASSDGLDAEEESFLDDLGAAWALG